MQHTLSHTSPIIKLNEEKVTRTYSVEVINYIEQGKNKSHSAIAMEFDLTFNGVDQEGFLNFRMKVQKRFLLSEKFSIIRKLDKAQKVALKVAVINDKLEFKVDKSFKLNRIVNTEEIRQKWEEVKVDLLEEYPDLLKMANDFDWQVQEDNIQQVFIDDNFHQFFFANIFHQEFENNKTIEQPKVISNALGSINIPIIEHKKISKQDDEFSNVTITSDAEMDVNHKKFSFAKLNEFLGKLATNTGDRHTLDFDYKGVYEVSPEFGLITNGKLAYTFELKDLYKKITTITFNIVKDE